MQNLPLGSVIQTYGNVDLDDFYVADGRTLWPYEYPQLFALLGYQYGGSATGPFNLPTIAPSNGIHSLIRVR